MIDFTTVIGIDNKHFEQLRIVWPTWKRYRAELMSQPILFVCDELQRTWSEWNRLLRDTFEHDNISVVTWRGDETTSQRARMLTALTFAPLDVVRTPWFFKVDTDTFANRRPSGGWILDKWFRRVDGKTPVLVGPSWSYSKPGDVIDRLDKWCGEHDYPNEPLNIPQPNPTATKVYHRRIAGYTVFINTDWARETFTRELFNDTLPVPTWDTTLWYFARRNDEQITRMKPKSFGWNNKRSTRQVRRLCEKIMRNAE